MKKVGLIVLALVIALGALGVGYAAWTQTLTIQGSVTTGTFSPSWVFTSNDPQSEPIVANETYTNVSPASLSGYADATVTFAVVNAYPGYTSSINFTLTNSGTVPIKLNYGTPEFYGDSHLLAALAGSSYVSAYTEGSSIAPGDSVSGSLNIVVDQDASNIISNKSVTGTITMTVAQAN